MSEILEVSDVDSEFNQKIRDLQEDVDNVKKVKCVGGKDAEKLLSSALELAEKRLVDAKLERDIQVMKTHVLND